MSWALAGATIASGLMSMYGQNQANQANARMAAAANAQSAENTRAQIEFQREMSRTAHQREVADLRKAGLNPILSAGGQGASTPIGGAAPVQVAKMENTLDKAGSTVRDAIAAKQSQDALESQIQVNKANAMAQTASANRDMTTAKNVATQTEILEKTAPAQISRAQVDQAQAAYDMKSMGYRNTAKRLEEGLGVVNSAKDALTPFKGFQLPTKNNNDGVVIKNGKAYDIRTNERRPLGTGRTGSWSNPD